MVDIKIAQNLDVKKIDVFNSNYTEVESQY